MKLPHLIVRLIVPETNSDVRNIELKCSEFFFFFFLPYEVLKALSLTEYS